MTHAFSHGAIVTHSEESHTAAVTSLLGPHSFSWRGSNNNDTGSSLFPTPTPTRFHPWRSGGRLAEANARVTGHSAAKYEAEITKDIPRRVWHGQRKSGLHYMARFRSLQHLIASRNILQGLAHH
jgi:hypothetical protein